MKPKDKNYLSLQFWHKIYTKDGSDFQSFFESIMQKAFPEFQKIRPYGKMGDGGNDGYIKKLGAYYQVYAPDSPSIKEAEAAKKLKDDFEKLKNEWNQISEIKKYYFVYNDKNKGSIQRLEETITILKKSNTNIEFEIFNPNKLEKVFFSLDDADMLNLGFDIDSMKAIANAYEYLKLVEIALDREDANQAFTIHKQIDNIIKSINDEKLEFEYKLLRGRCLQKLERINEAKEIYQNLSKRYLTDPRPNLYQAEIFLSEKKYGLNKLLLEQADQTHWLHKVEELIRKSTLGEKIDFSLIDEKSFPEDPIIKSNFYRLYSRFYEQAKDTKMADNFIEKAIFFNPNRFSNYDVNLYFIENRLFTSLQKNENFENDLDDFLREVGKVEKKFSELGNLRERSKATLLLRKLSVHRVKENIRDHESIVRKIFDIILKCYFDQHIESILIGLLWGIYLPREDLTNLISYLKQTDVDIDNRLSESIIVQFILHNLLFSEGKKFFIEKGKKEYVSFIENIENKEYEKVITFLKDNTTFAISISDSLKDYFELRELIIQHLPDDKYQTKEKLLLLLYSDKNDTNKAFEILKEINLSASRYIESRELFKVVQKKNAWEIEIRLIEKLLQFEKDPKILINLKLQLFNAHSNLKDYLGSIKIGEEILDEYANKNDIDPKNKEALLAHTIQSYLKRGEDDKANEILNKYKFLSSAPEFKVNIETEVYIKNNLGAEALNSLVSAVKIKKRLSPEEYASLFYLLIQIDNQIKIELLSFEKVESNCFVKLKNQDMWYYIGEDDELDATKINIHHSNYDLFIDKKVGNIINFSGKYSSKEIIETIEIIFPIEKYIFWQSRYNFEKLSKEERWG